VDTHLGGRRHGDPTEGSQHCRGPEGRGSHRSASYKPRILLSPPRSSRTRPQDQGQDPPSERRSSLPHWPQGRGGGNSSVAGAGIGKRSRLGARGGGLCSVLPPAAFPPPYIQRETRTYKVSGTHLSWAQSDTIYEISGTNNV
jgi:hypothetical protein